MEITGLLGYSWVLEITGFAEVFICSSIISQLQWQFVCSVLKNIVSSFLGTIMATEEDTLLLPLLYRDQ